MLYILFVGWMEPPLLTAIYETLFLLPRTFEAGGPLELALTPTALYGPPTTFIVLEEVFLRVLLAEELFVRRSC